jgi:cellulose synthase/poly-beta-1,6-N-acetylglucosamine synthase-like glycosyltransferase
VWVLTTFFAAATLLMAWLCAAYFVVLCFISFLRKRHVAVQPEELPALSIVIPCFNEEANIVGKLENLLASDYPISKLEIVFADGGSTDETLNRLIAAIPEGRPVRVLRCTRGGKINQLNEVLPGLTGKYVVNTDADARLRPDTLKQLAAEFADDERTWVVGAFSYTSNATWRDKCFWDSQNRGRLIESDAYSSSIVIATCYAFRREMIAQFPEDVVADDVYVAFLANSLGHRVVYSRQAIVEELRGPRGISEFLSHKFRKNNAFLRESLRFLYRLPEMRGYCKLMMLTRISQQLFLPWAAALWSVIALTMLTLGRMDLLVVAAASIALLMMITNRAFHSVDVPAGTTTRYGILPHAIVFAETICVLFAAALSYAFYRQSSSYARLGQAAPVNDLPTREIEFFEDQAASVEEIEQEIEDVTELLEESDIDLFESSPLVLFDVESPLHESLVCGTISERAANAA